MSEQIYLQFIFPNFNLKCFQPDFCFCFCFCLFLLQPDFFVFSQEVVNILDCPLKLAEDKEEMLAVTASTDAAKEVSLEVVEVDSI